METTCEFSGDESVRAINEKGKGQRTAVYFIQETLVENLTKIWVETLKWKKKGCEGPYSRMGGRTEEESSPSKPGE